MRQLYPRASRLRFFVLVAAFSVITLSASSPTYSAATGVRFTGRTSKSPVAAAAQADCSKAAATEIVLRLHLNDPEVDGPVGKVLCGSFTGPGSQTMVVSLWGPGNTGFIDWAVFRWTGDAWEFLMKQPAAASITAAGPDIRQTLPIYRPSDSRCCPTGGTKSRIWHWNGSSFTASPWKLVAKGKGEPSRFDSPSHNIHCSMFDGSGKDYSRGVGCNSDTPRRMVNMNTDGRLTIRGIPKAWCGCKEPDFPRLGYGKQLTVGRFRCQSQQAGVTCTLIRSGKGFLISRAGVRRVGH
jgi:hypothetical protein